MIANTSSPSSALLAANERLYELRQQKQRERPSPSQSNCTQQPVPDLLPWELPCVQAEISTTVEQVKHLPSHLGWGSAAITDAVRDFLQRQQLREGNPVTADHLNLPGVIDDIQPSNSQSSLPAKKQTSLPLYKDTIKHYPSIGVAALKEEQATTYRVWLMCRHLDSVGQGWLGIQLVRQQFTSKESELRLFGWRRLRQILGQGHGCFWNWDKQNGRLWLYGAARVAANLNVTRLTGKPVALPAKVITASMGEFKAHLYAAWHSGRKHNNPISRHTQTTITSIPERTQRYYCQVAGIERQSNVAIGSRYNSDSAKEAVWQRGRAVFEFVDYKGWQRKKNGRYLAWHLPNSYTSLHQQAPTGRMKKINRKLKDLVNKGTQGNEQQKIVKLYYANGARAARAVNCSRQTDIYWPVRSKKKRKIEIWSVLSP